MKTLNQTGSVNSNQQVRSAFAGTMKVCRDLGARFNQLKERLMQTLAGEFRGGIPGQMLERAVLEAEALAWATPYPLLFLPVLAEEKVLGARQWAEHQRRILERQGRNLRGNW